MLISISFVIFTYIVYEVLLLKNVSFDERAAGYCSDHYSKVLVNFFSFFTFLGSQTGVVAGYVILISWLFISKNRHAALRILITGISGYLMVRVMKILFQRERPLVPLLPPLKTYSFPSGHTTTATIFFGLLIYIIWEEARMKKQYKIFLTIISILVAIFIGLSRIYLREHFATDVIGGFFIAIFFVIVSTTLLQKIKYFHERKI
ncbi:phosphatase PAP2 family protein [soil metagenome]